MPTYVNPDACNACAGEHLGPLCVYICPNDLRRWISTPTRVSTGAPAVLGVLRLRQAMPAGGHPCSRLFRLRSLGASVQPRRVDNGLTWTVTFRNGKVLEFTYPSRSTPVGSSEPYKDFTEDPVNDLKGQGLAGESLWLGVDSLPSLQASN